MAWVLIARMSKSCKHVESGQAGRKGQDQCKSTILYSNIMAKHCHEIMFTYLKQKKVQKKSSFGEV